MMGSGWSSHESHELRFVEFEIRKNGKFSLSNKCTSDIYQNVLYLIQTETILRRIHPENFIVIL